MSSERLLVIGLDGFDPEVAEALIALGKLPHLAELRSSARSFRLQHGIEKFTGLAWEQFSSGLRPEESSRWSAISMDTTSYVPEQAATRLKPFVEDLDADCVVFDVPYFDLSATRRTRGMVSWGSHDPGVPAQGNPDGLREEIRRRFGKYPAPEYIYGHVWHNAEWAADMAEKMVAAVELRREITRWLFAERLPDWDLAITVISEFHSATEALWHGWDDSHPLHSQPSSAVAREGFLGVYEAADRMLGEMIEAFPGVRILVFSPHGMGRNLADLPAMLLLPELVYRWSTGKEAFTPDPAWAADGSGSPDLENVPNWSYIVSPRIDVEIPHLERWRQRRVADSVGPDWMPASQYRRAWPMMKAFAVPAYYDGRVRVNLKGREARGRVPLRRYGETLDELCGLIEECTDPVTGEAVDVDIDAPRSGDPRKRESSDADLIVRFKKDYYGFHHPRFGTIGPAPCRRTGGHTGGMGAGWFWNESRTGSDLGVFATVEVASAVGELMGAGGKASGLGAALAGN